jgi:hypothetical protein
MVALAGSATYRLPALSAAMPSGALKRAAAPVPSFEPEQTPQMSPAMGYRPVAPWGWSGQLGQSGWLGQG